MSVVIPAHHPRLSSWLARLGSAASPVWLMKLSTDAILPGVGSQCAPTFTASPGANNDQQVFAHFTPRQVIRLAEALRFSIWASSVPQPRTDPSVPIRAMFFE